MFCGSVQRFRFAVRTKHSTFRSAIAVSHYFCFWTACSLGSKDTLAKFENAVLVDVYNCLCVYRYFSRNSLRTKHTTFLCSIASCVHKVFIFLSRPDTSNSRADFSTDGSSRPDRIFTIRRWNIYRFPRQFDFRQWSLVPFLTSRPDIRWVGSSTAIDDPTQFMYILDMCEVTRESCYVVKP